MKFGIFYEHQLPRPWHERSEYELLQNSLTEIELADRLGYDYFFFTEHHFQHEGYEVIPNAILTGLVLAESVLIGVTGGALGLAVGTGLTPVLVSSLRILSGLELPMRTAGPFLFYSLAGALLIAVLAGLYPIWRMNRVDAVRAVRSG